MAILELLDKERTVTLHGFNGWLVAPAAGWNPANAKGSNP